MANRNLILEYYNILCYVNQITIPIKMEDQRDRRSKGF